MKLKYVLLLYVLPIFAFAQNGTWTWMKGDTTYYNFSFNYGQMNVPAESNEPPGRYDAAFWADTGGHFWVYGGVDPFGKLMNDLWMFDAQTLTWTWMNSRLVPDSNSVIVGLKGVFDSLNKPRSLAYCPFTWVTPDNHLWLFSGENVGASNNFSNEMWQYDPAINAWAWMGNALPVNHGVKGTGSATTSPGARIHGNFTWTDKAGNLWLYGGIYLNPTNQFWYQMSDIWKYSPANGVWTWMSGDSTNNSAGSYGPVGVESVNYWPMARNTDFFWKDDTGNVWLIGGENYISSTFYNDVWKFNPANLGWTLIQGGPTSDTTNYTTGNCEADTSNRQGGRYQNRAVWKLCDNVVINYGGFKTEDGFTNNNDLWAFLPGTKTWVRINDGPNHGSYGVQLQPSPNNYPPSRAGSAAFIDKKHDLWLFSGNGTFANDVWKFTIDTSCLGPVSCPWVTGVSGTNEVVKEDLISIYPNPTSGILKIHFKGGKASIRLTDLPGQTLFSMASIDEYQTIDLKEFASGVYLLTFFTSTGTTSRRVLKNW